MIITKQELLKRYPKGIIYNAKFTSIEICFEDHGIMTIMMDTKHEMGNQGYGNYNLNNLENLGEWIKDCITIFGPWSKITGKNCRVLIDDRRMIRAVGDIMEDKWFIPKDVFNAP